MTYYCICCEYDAKVKSSYDKHMKTKKHSIKHKEYTKETGCVDGNIKNFQHQSSLSKHVNHTCKHNDDNQKILKIVKLIQEENLKRETEFVKMKLQLNELYKKMEDINKRICGFYSLR